MRHSVLFLICIVLQPAHAGERPNFILFIADDVSWNDWGCYGNPAARTPNIDALAADGMRCSNFYLTASSCSPSRCSIITGRYPHNNGEACELHRPLPSHLTKFPQRLKEAGYFTALAGKDHMPQRSPHEDDVWSLKKGGTVPGNSGGEGHWLDVVRARPKDQPFFFWFASLDAHRDWDADRQWDAERYGPKHRPENVVVPPFLLDDSVTRQDLASYYNEITRFDYYVGQVIEELRRQEVLDDTVILILADNGRCFPRAKTRLHDPGMKSPLVIHWPNGLASNNVNCTQLISAIDLCPTILSLAEVAVPGSVQGISLGPVLTRNLEGGELARRYAFSEHNWHDYQAHGRAVRTADGFLYVRNARPEMGWLGPADSISSPSHVSLREKLKENAESLTAEQRDTFVEPRPSEELYFTPDDPHQIRNLIQDVRHASTLEELRGTMNRWQDETGDSVPEDLSPDYFDRLGGYLDSATGQRIQGERVLGTPPGADRRADWIDAAGPR